MSREQTLGFQVLRLKIFFHLLIFARQGDAVRADGMIYCFIITCCLHPRLFICTTNSTTLEYDIDCSLERYCGRLDQMYSKVYYLVLPPEVSPQSLS